MVSNPASAVLSSTSGSNKTLGGAVSWNPNDSKGGLDTKGNTSRPAFVGLAHELAHVWAAMNGRDRSSETWMTFSNGDVRTKSEFLATHFENQIRSENNLPLRAYYADGREGSLLVPGTSLSMFFYHLKYFSADGTDTMIQVPYDYSNDVGKGGNGLESK